MQNKNSGYCASLHPLGTSNLPSKLKNFVGRNGELNDLKEKLEFSEEKNILVITGGPGYGKSSLAVHVGHEMLEKDYDYVIWINMRDIAEPVTLDEVALKIIDELNVYDDGSNVVTRLKEVLNYFSKINKKVLLIYDNADAMLQFGGILKELSELITQKSVKAIFTTRICSNESIEKDQMVVVGPLNDKVCHDYLSQALDINADITDKAALMIKLVKLSQGLPFALEVISSFINRLRDIGKIKEFVDAYDNIPNEMSNDENSSLSALFTILSKMLQADEMELLSMLAVFHSGFSYEYVTRISELLSVNPDVIEQLHRNSLISRTAQGYQLHPFLREFIMGNIWDKERKQTYEEAYYKVYIKQIFELAKDSLKKDNYVDSMKKFEREKPNFFHVMMMIAKMKVNVTDDPMSQIVEETLQRSSVEYIAAMIFYKELTNPALLLDFFKGCEQFAIGEMKRVIWCCRKETYLRYYEEGLEDPYKHLSSEKYERILIEKRRINDEIHDYGQITVRKFKELDNRLRMLLNEVEKCESSAIKEYLLYYVLKAKATLYKKASHLGPLNISKKMVITVFLQALEVCKAEFGNSWFTIDCYNQLGKAYWKYKDINNARAAFDEGIAMATAMSLTDTRKFKGSSLLDKGRFLIDTSTTKTDSLEGIQLLEKVVRESERDVDVMTWASAIAFLAGADPKRHAEVIEKFLEDEGLNSYVLSAVDTVLRHKLKSAAQSRNWNEAKSEEGGPLVAEMRKLIDHLQKICQSSQEDQALLREAWSKLFDWNKEVATKCERFLSAEERAPFAKRALEIYTTHHVKCTDYWYNELVKIAGN